MSIKPLHVAVAAVVDGEGRVLISYRSADRHQGGLWEFPGGKVEGGETVTEALSRELSEELSITPINLRPLIRILHHYPQQTVLLDVWRAGGYHGVVTGCEGQPFRWVASGELSRYRFPNANTAIIKALTLPNCYLITPEPDLKSGLEGYLSLLRQAIEEKGIELLQFRAKGLSGRHYAELAQKVIELGHALGARVLLNSGPEWVSRLGADGVHLTADRALALQQRPLAEDALVAISCHRGTELAHAVALNADFALLSPVNTTQSHPTAPPIGWQRFAELVDGVPLPVYALGGVALNDLTTAWDRGAQGVAAIRDLWPS